MSGDLINQPEIYESSQIAEEKKDRVRTSSFQTGRNIALPDLFQIAHSCGLIECGTFDQVEYGIGPTGDSLLTYSLAGLTQFQVDIDFISQTSFNIFKRPAEFPLLQENGDFLLQENGDKLLVQGLIP